MSRAKPTKGFMKKSIVVATITIALALLGGVLMFAQAPKPLNAAKVQDSKRAVVWTC
jgi:hypothetical protein